MRRRLPLSLLFLVAVVVLVWVSASSNHPPHAVKSEGVSGNSNTDAIAGTSERAGAGTPKLHGAGPSHAGAEDDLRGLPAPVDLTTVDRRVDLHGIVVDKQGEPVASAHLQVVYYDWRSWSILTDGRKLEERAGAHTRSASDGTFAMRLRPGDVVHLRASSPGLASTELSDLQAGERVRVVLREAVRLIVKVLAPENVPAAGLPLHLFRSGRGATAFERRGVTGPDGVHGFEDLPPGGSAWLDPQPQHEGWGDLGYVTVLLPESGDLTHTLVLPRGRTLRGRVTDARTGDPIEDARVGMTWALRPETRTGADGRYVLLGWTGQGVKEIHVLATGYGREQAIVGEREVLDFQLVRGCSVKGRVLTSDGMTVAQAQVAAVGSVRKAGEQRISMDSGHTDAEGRFTLSGLRLDMTHSLVVLAEGHGRLLLKVPPRVDSETTDLGDLRLPRACTLLGRVENSEGDPVPRVRVSLRDATAAKADFYGRAARRYSDDLGRFRFPDLSAGRYTLSVSRTGAPGVRTSVTVAESETPTETTLVVETGREIRVRVVACDDRVGIEGVSVYLRDRSALGRVYAMTDVSGEAVLRVPQGPVSISVGINMDRSLSTPRPIKVAPDRSEVEFVLERAAFTTVTVLDPDGKPLAGAVVAVEQEGESTTGHWSTDGEGRFTLRLPAGAVVNLVLGRMVTATDGEKTLLTGPYVGSLDSVRAGTGDVVLRATAVPPDRALTVRVLAPDGTPVEGVQVLTSSAAPGAAPHRTDTTGRVRLETMPATSQQITLVFLADRERPWIRPPPRRIVPEGQEVTFHLRAGGLVEGTLVKPDGSPAVGGRVIVPKKDGTFTFASAGADGRFTLVVDPEAAVAFTLRCEARGADGANYHAVREGVRVGDRNLVVLMEDEN